ncbi:CaiB/BaiF CoA-transferase family protein [Pseudomonadales bacterium]|nr:CaiB/BaiF CoA-transferase family protein [Pseudomonadales bacterium]
MRPLEGLLVVSIEQAVAAPFCTARLVEAGARVIKVERPAGDFARGYDQAALGDSSYFVWINQGKESVVLDFKTPADAELLHALIAKADIFVQNLAPGALERAGFGSASLRGKNPRLITCDISGYGETAAVKELKAYDLLVQAESGLVDISGGPGERGRIGVSISDIGTGMTAHAAVLEALIKRSVTGKGSGVSMSLFDVTAEWMTVPLIHAEHGKGAPTRGGLHHPSIAPYGAYQTSDGIDTIVSIQNEREWIRYCEIVLQNPSLAIHTKFANNNLRVENRAALDAEIDAIVGGIDASEYRSRLAKADLAFGAVNTIADLANHIALRRRRIRTAEKDLLEIPATPIRWSDTDPIDSKGIPAIGADTEKIREEFLPD